MKIKKKGRLFRQAIVALSVVTAFPVMLIGWHALKVSSHSIQHEVLDNQLGVATQVAWFVADVIQGQEHLISMFSRPSTGKAPFRSLVQPSKLDNYQLPEAISAEAIFDKQGKTIFSSTKSLGEVLSKKEKRALLNTCVSKEKEYIGRIAYEGTRSFLWMGFPLRVATEPIYGVFAVRLALDVLNQFADLLPSYGNTISVVSDEGKVFSFRQSGKEFKWISRDNFAENFSFIKEQLKNKDQSLLQLPNGEKMTISGVRIPRTNWMVYVHRPADTEWILLKRSLADLSWHIWGVLCILLLFEIAVAYWVLQPIVKPLRRLKEVAVKLEREENYVPTEKDLLIPNNEIGEFEQIFLHMVDVLFERKYALQEAKQALLNMNKVLEERVAQRTAELNAINEKLIVSERLAAIGKMASIISHEIRNPLAVIRNAVRLIKIIQPPVEAKAIKQFSIIESEISHADGIIGEVLGFVRHRDMLLSRVDLNSYIHDIVISSPPIHNIRIEEALDKESVQLKMDAEEIKQALRNLISNACESMPEGGVVTVGTKVGKRIVCIYIMDEGPGLSDQVRQTMFLPFYTTKARGTGLGLAVVQKAVHRHQGKIFAHNRPKKGTIFEVYLKVYKKPGDTQYG